MLVWPCGESSVDLLLALQNEAANTQRLLIPLPGMENSASQNGKQ